MTLITVERLVERFEDKVAADEQREIELRGIRDELRGIRAALDTIAAHLWKVDVT